MKTLILLATAVCLFGCASAPLQQPPSSEGKSTAHDSAKTERLIDFHETRVKNDPQGALGWAMLSEAYLAKSRERDDDDASQKAEHAARKSLEIRKANNVRAGLALTSALLEQHRFEDALKAAKMASSLEQGNTATQRQVAEILLELGRYQEFEAMLPKVNLAGDPSGQVVLARWLEIKGEIGDAEQLLLKAAKESEQMAQSAPETTAWFYTRLGESQFRFGSIDKARGSLDRALKLDPSSYKACAAMTRLEAGLGNWKEVIRWGELTGKTAKMTDIQGLVADAYQNQGDKMDADRLRKEVISQNATPEMLAQKPGHSHTHGHSHAPTKRHTHDRLFSLFLADRNLHPFLAHHAAEEDLSTRKDIYAWDTFAWATYQYFENVPASITGEGDFLLTESQQAIDKALATGVKDARILFHAGMIYRRTNPAKAREFLAKSLELNPNFNAQQAALAREELATFQTQGVQK